MIFNKLEWPMAYRNLWRNKRRTMAFIMAMTFSVGGLSILGGYIARTESIMRVIGIYLTQNGHISIYKNGGADNFLQSPKKFQIQGSDLEKLEQILATAKYKDDISFHGSYLEGMGLISRNQTSTTFFATGIDPEVNQKIYQVEAVKNLIKDFELPNPEVDLMGSMKNDPNSISITKSMSELLGLKYPIETNTNEERDVQIVAKSVFGDLNATNAYIALNHTTGMTLLEDTSLMAPVKLIQDLLAMDGVSHVAIYLNDDSKVRRVVNELKGDIKNANLPLDVLPFYDESIGQFYIGTMGFLSVITVFFVLLIYTANLLSLSNVVNMNVLERTREIGTMRSLGFDQKMIARVFAIETFIVSIFSVVIGNVLMTVVAQIVNSLNIRFMAPYIPGTLRIVLYTDNYIRVLVALPLIITATLISYWLSKRKTRKQIIHLLSDVVR